MEKKTQTLAELKGEEVMLRDRIEQDKGTVKDVLDLDRIRRVIVKLESVLLWSILTLILMLSGCNLAREGLYGTGRCIGALGEDVKWTADRLAGNIQVEKE